MAAKMILRKQELEIKSGMTVRAALQKLGLEPDSVLATRDGQLLTDDEIVKENDVIKLVPVISGGCSPFSGIYERLEHITRSRME
jgi:sulfur carrier protein ThiS